MPALQVRDFPPTLYDELKEYAARNHRSIAQQTIIAVEEMLAASAQLASSVESPKQGPLEPFGEHAVGISRQWESWPQSRTISEQRLWRRQQVFANFDKIAWKKTLADADDVVTLINEGREERLSRILASVDSPEYDD